ncbi:MAG: hypothetical protein K2X06_03300 [Burkholderiales bacterium]|nr:hypothetical protein [Burkholderiales bacterium]
MAKEMFKNKDLIVFWTAVVIAACDLLSSGFFAIQEVVAAPAHVAVSATVQMANAQDAAEQRWVERMARLSAR